MPEVDDKIARYSLYWTWDSAAMSCHAALEELGVDYSLRFINFDLPCPDDYTVLNPYKKVPTLIDHQPAGTAEPGKPIVVYPSAAILLYLADTHAERGLLPVPQDPGRAPYYQWLFFLAEALQPAFLAYFYPERHTTDKTGCDAIQQQAIDCIYDIWGRIDHQIGSSPFIVGQQMSVCDLFILPMAWWNRDGTEFKSLGNYPHLLKTLDVLHNKPSIAQMMDRHCQQ